MTSKSALAAQVIADLRSVGITAWDTSDEELRELVECSRLIRERKRKLMCGNGMTEWPECRTLSQAIRDIRNLRK